MASLRVCSLRGRVGRMSFRFAKVSGSGARSTTGVSVTSFIACPSSGSQLCIRANEDTLRMVGAAFRVYFGQRDSRPCPVQNVVQAFEAWPNLPQHRSLHKSGGVIEENT